MHVLRPFLFLALCSTLPGQIGIPGQYPPGGTYPPGGYPPNSRGRYPGQTPPQQTPTGQPRGRSPQSTTKNSKKEAAIVTTTGGILRRATGNQLVIEADDHRIIWYGLADKADIEKEGKPAKLETFVPGDYLSVDSTSDDNGNFTATSVTWKNAGSPADKAVAERTWDLPRLAQLNARPASDERPVLRRQNSQSGDDDDRPIIRRQKQDAPDAAASPDKPQAQDNPRPAAPPKQEAAAQEPEPPVDTRPSTQVRPDDPKPEADDPGRPVLRRGAAAARRPSTTSESSTIASTVAPRPSSTSVAAPSPGPGSSQGAVRGPVSVAPPPEPAPAEVSFAREAEDSVIAKAREAIEAYQESLPNYFARQMTTRYQSEGRKDGWRALDIVTADIAYEDGNETYKNIKIGNKAATQKMEDIEGTRSTGEFSSMQESLMGEGSGAIFRRRGSDTIRDRAAWVYNWEIPREQSRWRIEAPSQLYYPALKGSVWIDKQTSRVLRIEQQGRNMPALFPFDSVETTADYDFVRLGTTKEFLLPVEAEVLSCQRGSSLCSRNKIEFRNYRKFGSESDISFGDTLAK